MVGEGGAATTHMCLEGWLPKCVQETIEKKPDRENPVYKGILKANSYEPSDASMEVKLPALFRKL